MKITKAIVTMGSTRHRELPFQHITTGEGKTMRTAELQIEEFLAAGIERVGLIVGPGTVCLFDDLRAEYGDAVEFIQQPEALGFGHAVLCAEQWLAAEPFLLQVCDHMFITCSEKSCTRQLIEVAQREQCAVSAVQSTHESQLPYFGTISGRRVRGEDQLYVVESVFEKPTPTVAEQHCMISGMRQGTYLSFFGTHAFPASLFDCLRASQANVPAGQPLGLSEALSFLAAREKYLAVEILGHRIDLEGPFGLLRAQVALALSGSRREEVLRLLIEELALAQPHYQPQLRK